MGYEKMERRVPCPCGKGLQVVEWEEHDTWARGDEFGEYRLECEEYAARYASYWYVGHGQAWILKQDNLKLNSLESEVKEDREKLHRTRAVVYVVHRDGIFGSGSLFLLRKNRNGEWAVLPGEGCPAWIT